MSKYIALTYTGPNKLFYGFLRYLRELPRRELDENWAISRSDKKGST